MLNADDERLGRLLRLIRRRGGLTQVVLAKRAAIPVRDVVRIESGRVAEVPVDRVRRAFEAIGGRARLVATWEGAAADRLLDAAHAALVEAAVRVLRQRGWTALPEVSFSEYGERGSIDVFGVRESARAVAVCEIKSDFGSLEETNRVLDMKERLAPVIAKRVLGWRPDVIGRILVVPDHPTIRRVVARHAATMDAVYPARSREVRAWLRAPTRAIRGVWFLSIGRNAATGSG